MKCYDFLIVGSGLYAAVFANEATRRGKRCLMIEKRNHIGGNIFCENIEGINVHKYGAHIFHTNDKSIWEYVNSFAEFNNYVNSPLAAYKNKLYNLPFNMNTFYQLWGVKSPVEAANIIKRQVSELGIVHPKNFEEQALCLVGTDIYKKLIQGYTEKQWGRSCKNLPSFIIKRLPVRFTFNNNYFTDKYQGVPIGGYTKLIEGLLKGIELKTSNDFFQDRDHWTNIATNIIFTGSIDEFYHYRFGRLEYRSLNFEHKILPISNFQGNAVINYTERSIPYTRILEHKHFEFGEQPSTVITYEYPSESGIGREPYYPINDSKNDAKYNLYKNLASLESNIFFGGRLAEYKYYDMHQVIQSALSSANRILNFPNQEIN